jgi:uncharacterized integral membrane protein (TIGR00698 family)
MHATQAQRIDGRRHWSALAPGFALSVLVAAVAGATAARVPFGSAPVFAVVLGALAGSALGARPALRPGIAASGSLLLRGAVVMLGAELPLVSVIVQGAHSLPAIAITLGGCLWLGALLGRRLGIADPLRTLVTGGTGICGASAIAAAAPVVEAEELDVGYAVATIFLYNVLAILLFPPLGRALGLTPHAFGVFSGTAVNDLSSVVAAGNAFGPAALQTGVVVKLARTLMIVPICALLAGRRDRAAGHAGHSHPTKVRLLTRAALDVPRFLLAFLILATLASTGAVPAGLTPAIGDVATAMMTIALGAVGLSIDLPALRSAGVRPIMLGAALWGCVSALSLLTQLLGIAG